MAAVPRRRHCVALAAAAVAVSGCGDLTAGGAADTLAPLVPDRTGPPITQAVTIGPDGNPVVNTQGSTTTLPRQPGVVVADATEGSPLAAAAGFLDAAASGDEATAAGLEASGRSPTVVQWATAAYAQYTQVAGVEAWGPPTCTEAQGAFVTCSWLQTETPPTLVLVEQDGAWLVSHPLFNVAAEPTVAGSGCIVGSINVNLRGGPSTDWPRFDQIAPGTCSVTVFDAVQTDGAGDRWRLIELDGRRGWIIERVIDL